MDLSLALVEAGARVMVQDKEQARAAAGNLGPQTIV